MTNSMIEIAVEAASRALTEDRGPEEIVRAILTAIREPNEAMVKAGGAALAQYIEALSDEERAKLRPRQKRTGEMLGYRIRPDLKCSLRWTACIDSILKEGT